MLLLFGLFRNTVQLNFAVASVWANFWRKLGFLILTSGQTGSLINAVPSLFPSHKLYNVKMTKLVQLRFTEIKYSDRLLQVMCESDWFLSNIYYFLISTKGI